MEKGILNNKILFITPPYHAGILEMAGRWVPLYLIYLSGAARQAGWEPVVHDAMSKFSTYEEIEKVIRDERPEVVGMGAITSTINETLKVLKLVKGVDPTIKTLLGGIHPTFMYEEILNDQANAGAIDFIVIGEGETTLTELLTEFDAGGGDFDKIRGLVFERDGQMVKTPKRPLATDLDTLPAAWDVLDYANYSYFPMRGSRLAAMATSRGCDQSCTFCSQQKMWEQKWRGRRPESLIAELRHLKEEYGVNLVLFTDEYPTKDEKRWEEFLDLAIAADLGVDIMMETRADDIVRDKDILWKYKKAGIMHMYVGVEATDQVLLDDTIKKGITVSQSREALTLLNEYGIITESSFILGFPDETPESIDKTLAIAQEFNPDMAHFVSICPWPYADIYAELKDKIEVFDYDQYNIITPVVKPDNMTLKEVEDAIISCYKRFYMKKMADIMDYEDEFKRNYMISAFHILMSLPFIKTRMGDMGEMPRAHRKQVAGK